MDPDAGRPSSVASFGLRDVGGRRALSSPEAVKAKAFETFRRIVHRREPATPWRSSSKTCTGSTRYRKSSSGSSRRRSPAPASCSSPPIARATVRPGSTDLMPPRAAASLVSRGQPRSHPLGADRRDSKTDGRGDRCESRWQSVLSRAARAACEEAQSLGSLMVPNTIHDVVMARIDRLPEETKRLLQTAAVIGREFSLRLLSAVWQRSRRARGKAARADPPRIHRRTGGPRGRFTFFATL